LADAPFYFLAENFERVYSDFRVRDSKLMILTEFLDPAPSRGMTAAGKSATTPDKPRDDGCNETG